MFYFENKQNNKKGFTIIESLVAIFILTVSVTALMTVVSQSIFNSNYIKNKTVAISIAQEGVELVRNIQDTALVNSSFSTFEVFAGTVFGPCILNEATCTIDAIDLDIASCPNQICPPILVSDDTGYFNYTFGEASMFTRTISIKQTSTNSGIAVVTVTWMQGGVERNVSYTTELFLWIN